MSTSTVGRHREPTQTAHPWRAAVRTFVQTWLPALVLLVLAVPEVVAAVDQTAGEHLPAGFRAWMAGVATAAAVLAATVARVMALASVTRFLRAVPGLGWLAPEPPSQSQEG